MCGYTEDNCARRRIGKCLTAPAFYEVTKARAHDLAVHGETEPYEKQMIRKDGTRWWGLFAPTRLGGSGEGSECVEFVMDITEQKRAEEALRAHDSLEVKERLETYRRIA